MVRKVEHAFLAPIILQNESCALHRVAVLKPSTNQDLIQEEAKNVC